MILDNGDFVFLWVGRKTSDVEIKLAFKSAQVHRILNVSIHLLKVITVNAHLCCAYLTYEYEY